MSRVKVAKRPRRKLTMFAELHVRVSLRTRTLLESYAHRHGLSLASSVDSVLQHALEREVLA